MNSGFLPSAKSQNRGLLSPTSAPAPTSFTPAVEDVQDIITPLPLISQLPYNSQGLVIRRGSMNGVSPQRTGTFILPPSIVRK